MDTFEIDLSQWEMWPSPVHVTTLAPQRSIYDITREFVRSINPEITTIFGEIYKLSPLIYKLLTTFSKSDGSTNCIL